MKMLWKASQTAVKLHTEKKMEDLVVGMGHFDRQL